MHHKNNPARRFRTTGLALAGLAAMLLAPLPAAAQGKYPDRPVKIVLPFGAGGVADITTRLVAEKLGEKLGQRFVVENNPGAGGISAARAVMSSPADGYTLAVFSNGTAVSVGLFKSLPFDPIKDFAPVSAMGYFDLVLVTNATGPYKTLGDFVKAAKEKPGQLNVGTIAAGSSQNLGAELFKSVSGLNFVIVPFKTSGDVLVALERNDIQMGAEFYAALRGGLEAKKFIPVAISGSKRGAYLPDAPTAKEAGEPKWDVTSWNAIFAPAGTPPDVIATLNKALNEVLADPEVKKKALELGIDARGSTPQEIQDRLKSDIAKWADVIQKAGIEKR
ncbi:tripartite tricarboxylate transporter substrate binding protein [Pseudorhodoplanes sp.]|uniref:Bug family tripartite tricarboxylate transporter substrate binding protein n=1 Tax=Pseudorhodoplanes sp. TaxID=1934341 RepID=UPI002C1D5C32|nr:tripartite tricarboxylate transporter substrate binding protein [Pseudorhodoplanes sp.]HWV54676.1 tripartite tricarboxylate transporter substrate binding protein [Pseudorhodoplanes sp.]